MQDRHGFEIKVGDPVIFQATRDDDLRSGIIAAFWGDWVIDIILDGTSQPNQCWSRFSDGVALIHKI